MRKKLTTYALVGAVGITAVTGTALVVPAVAHAATGDSSALDRRVASIKDALKGLVSDGTLTQGQADKVAGSLAASPPEGRRGHGREGGPGGRGVRLEALTPLGITAEEIRTAAAAGRTLAQLAEEQGVSREKLISALVAAGKEHLAEAVADGRLTQEEADDKATQLQTRITERLDEPLPERGRHNRR